MRTWRVFAEPVTYSYVRIGITNFDIHTSFIFNIYGHLWIGVSQFCTSITILLLLLHILITIPYTK